MLKKLLERLDALELFAGNIRELAHGQKSENLDGLAVAKTLVALDAAVRKRDSHSTRPPPRTSPPRMSDTRPRLPTSRRKDRGRTSPPPTTRDRVGSLVGERNADR